MIAIALFAVVFMIIGVAGIIQFSSESNLLWFLISTFCVVSNGIVLVKALA